MKKAVIMAGGFGTRLRPLTMNVPKPMVPILNTPMMEHIVNLLKKHKITDIVSVLYFQPETITEYFENGARFGVDMKYEMAKADYGTAGAVKNAEQHLKEPFIIISGDVLTDFDLSEAIAFHKEKKSLATILLTRVSNPLQFGIVMADEEGRIIRFLEKPSWGQVFSDTINTGIYILEPEVLDLIPQKTEFDFSKDLYPLMLSKKLPLFGYIAEGYWRDIGNLNEYQKGQFDAVAEKVQLEVKGVKKDNVTIGNNSKVAPTAKLSGNVIIGDDTIIEDYVEITDSVISDNVRIGNGSKIKRSTIWNDVMIGDFAELSDDVICSHCKIGNSATIFENVFISDFCEIGENANLLPNIKLWPKKRVHSGATLSRSLVQEEKWVGELFTDARISGASNIEIQPEFGAKLGAAIGMVFKPNSYFLTSRDPDTLSRLLKRTITSGLASVGINVNDLQIVSIPQTRQEIRTGKYAGGIHIRRSPRNPNMTDIIIFNSEGRDIGTAVTKSIERYFYGEDIRRVHYEDVGEIRYPERSNEIYLDRFLDSLDREAIRQREFKVLMDYSYGLASNIYPRILGKLGVDALSLHDYVDAYKYKSAINHQLQEGEEAVKIMRSLGYELGFILEPGAEKISVVDERGVLYAPARLLAIVTKLFLETNRDKEPYRIGVSIVASSAIEEIAKDYNVEIFRVQDSHSAMMEATRVDSDKELKVPFVGGVWGGFIFSDFLFASDGMYSVGKILEMLALTNYTVSELDEKLPRRFQHISEAYCPWESKGTVMRKAMEHSAEFKRELIEGVKIFFDDSSVLLLPDKEKAAFKIFAESNQFESAVIIARKYNSLITQWKDE
ncbi:MAG: NTP transferase domain-containing protein [Ignavibacteria bacterium]|jgi:mannose-1-phosphate guanylyltransferase/phosphomannomutase|nr:NTP transferase domain-containing protein [Ignavibacteria bacterium]